MMVFKKYDNVYYMETSLPVGWEPLDYEELESILKLVDTAAWDHLNSRTPTMDQITEKTITFLILSLKKSSRFLYSDLKWTFFIHMMEKLGFKFMEVITPTRLEEKYPIAYPLEEVR